jgi:hypothetical protein
MNSSLVRKLALSLPLCAASVVVGQTAHNTLNPAEAASGYELLFNGTNLNGWRGWNTTVPPNSWSVVAESTWNVIRNGSGSAGQVALVTADSTFQNFDIKYEYWIPAKGNAGVFIRYNKYNSRDWGGCCGPETQIAALDNSDGTNALHRNGTCYDMFGLNSEALNWDKIRLNNTKNDSVYHQFRIVAFNNRVAHYGNGVKLLEYDMTSSVYNSRYAASKYAPEPIYKTVHQGGFYLQHHGETGIRFRNMRVKRLTQSPWAQGSTYLSNPSDSASGLKSSLAFSEALFPTAIAPAGKAGAARLNTRVLRGADGVSLLLDRAGDYAVRVNDLRGRTVFQGSIRNASQIQLPAEAFSGETRVLTLQPAAGGPAHREIVSPVQ